MQCTIIICFPGHYFVFLGVYNCLIFSFPNFVVSLIIYLCSNSLSEYKFFKTILTHQVIYMIHVFLGDYRSRDFCSNQVFYSVLLFQYISFPELSSYLFPYGLVLSQVSFRAIVIDLEIPFITLGILMCLGCLVSWIPHLPHSWYISLLGESHTPIAFWLFFFFFSFLSLACLKMKFFFF